MVSFDPGIGLNAVWSYLLYCARAPSYGGPHLKMRYVLSCLSDMGERERDSLNGVELSLQ